MTAVNQVPYLLRAARHEVLDRPPVWMMRQAGRYMKVYRDLRDRYPSFRERLENPDLAIEISLQPWRAFRPDGVIMFSDILTPLPGMGIPFDIVESQGPIIAPPFVVRPRSTLSTALIPKLPYPISALFYKPCVGKWAMKPPS
jgi:uroporphyrinogen decarboxylase